MFYSNIFILKNSLLIDSIIIDFLESTAIIALLLNIKWCRSWAFLKILLLRFLPLSSLPSGHRHHNSQWILWYISCFGFACVYHFGTDKTIGLWRMCCYCHKGKAMFTLLFFLLQAAVCGFPEHFNLLSSWTREMWPCPLITPSRLVVVNIRCGLCKRAMQSAFRTNMFGFFGTAG